MINHFHIQAQNHQNPKDDHNLLTNQQDVVTTTQLQNYKKLCNTTKQGEVHRTVQKVEDPSSPNHVTLHPKKKG
jgi:hypothetical protein